RNSDSTTESVVNGLSESPAKTESPRRRKRISARVSPSVPPLLSRSEEAEAAREYPVKAVSSPGRAVSTVSRTSIGPPGQSAGQVLGVTRRSVHPARASVAASARSEGFTRADRG